MKNWNNKQDESESPSDQPYMTGQGGFPVFEIDAIPILSVCVWDFVLFSLSVSGAWY